MNWNDFLYLLGGGLIFAFVQLLIGFYREKGKNYATKQDVGEITDKIENVKKEYSVQIEKLKADLQLAIGNKSDLQEKTNNAILQVFEDSIILLHEKISINLLDIPKIEDLVEYQQSTEHLFTKIHIGIYRLSLYSSGNENFINPARDLALATIKMRKFFKKNFSPVKMAIIEEHYEIVENRMHNYKEVVSKTNDELDNYYSDLKPIQKNLQDAFENYNLSLNIYFQKMGTNIELE